MKQLLFFIIALAFAGLFLTMYLQYHTSIVPSISCFVIAALFLNLVIRKQKKDTASEEGKL